MAFPLSQVFESGSYPYLPVFNFDTQQLNKKNETKNISSNLVKL